MNMASHLPDDLNLERIQAVYDFFSGRGRISTGKTYNTFYDATEGWFEKNQHYFETEAKNAMDDAFLGKGRTSKGEAYNEAYDFFEPLLNDVEIQHCVMMGRGRAMGGNFPYVIGSWGDGQKLAYAYGYESGKKPGSNGNIIHAIEGPVFDPKTQIDLDLTD